VKEKRTPILAAAIDAVASSSVAASTLKSHDTVKGPRGWHQAFLSVAAIISSICRRLQIGWLGDRRQRAAQVHGDIPLGLPRLHSEAQQLTCEPQHLVCGRVSARPVPQIIVRQQETTPKKAKRSAAGRESRISPKVAQLLRTYQERTIAHDAPGSLFPEAWRARGWVPSSSIAGAARAWRWTAPLATRRRAWRPVQAILDGRGRRKPRAREPRGKCRLMFFNSSGANGAPPGPDVGSDLYRPDDRRAIDRSRAIAQFGVFVTNGENREHTEIWIS
jgi:hypothetical protein